MHRTWDINLHLVNRTRDNREIFDNRTKARRVRKQKAEDSRGSSMFWIQYNCKDLKNLQDKNKPHAIQRCQMISIHSNGYPEFPMVPCTCGHRIPEWFSLVSNEWSRHLLIVSNDNLWFPIIHTRTIVRHIYMFLEQWENQSNIW